MNLICRSVKSQIPKQRRRRVNHVDAFPVHNLSLIFRRRGRVDFRARLAVADEGVDSDAGRECTFPVLLWNLYVGISEATRAVFSLPSEDWTDNVPVLPGKQIERPAGELPFRVSQE